MKEYKKSFAVVKIDELTYTILRKLKENQGVPFTEGIRLAVQNYYGQNKK